MNRILVKTITYRVGGIAIEFVILYFAFGIIETATKITIFIEGIQTFWYFFHEKIYKVLWPITKELGYLMVYKNIADKYLENLWKRDMRGELRSVLR